MDYLTREQWGATYDVSGRALMTGLPVSLAFIHHTVTVPTDDPSADMAGIEAIDIGRFGVPSYSYVIHPSGVVLEGMGLHRGAHTIDNANHSFNDDAFGVSFIGNFENDEVTGAARGACVELLAWLVSEGHMHPDFTLSGHRDVYATACPGAHLYPLIGSIRESVDQPQEDDMFTDDDRATLAAVVGAISEVRDNGRKAVTLLLAEDAAGTGVDVDKLAAKLSETLGADVARALGQKLAG